jgi:hypothetical protein
MSNPVGRRELHTVDQPAIARCIVHQQAGVALTPKQSRSPLSLLPRILGTIDIILSPVLIDLISDHGSCSRHVPESARRLQASDHVQIREPNSCLLLPTRVANLLLAHGFMGKEGGTTHDSDHFHT